MYCPECGNESEPNSEFCVHCGKKLPLYPDHEIYLGGTASVHLRKGKFGMGGYGVYATNKRIFGIRDSNIMVKSNIAGFLGGGIGHTILDHTTPVLKDDSVKAIEDLERKKDFEIKKEDIAAIEWKKVNLWSGGHLLIKTKSTQEFLVGGDGKPEFEYLLSLMKSFYPEVLTIK